MLGIQHVRNDAAPTPTSSSLRARSDSGRSSPPVEKKGYFLPRRETASHATEEQASTSSDADIGYRSVVARVSTHSLRFEREYHLCKAFAQTSDPDCLHVIRLIDLKELPGRSLDDERLLCCMCESPGPNYLTDVIDFGPAFLGPIRVASNGVDPGEAAFDGLSGTSVRKPQLISISNFLEFAVGACECLELLHYGLKRVHGELRADAFHYNAETGAVKLVNFGSGPRAFENGFTSSGWLSLSRELGIKNKLQFIAPEQTGRMPAEPDSRTDIYSLGIIFWTLLSGRPAFTGESPIDVVQAVLARRLQPVSSIRLEVPDVLSHVIQRMTHKQIEDRYHSTSGLKHDLVEIGRLLGDGETDRLASMTLGTRDVSAFFMLPSKHFGREAELEVLAGVVDKVASRQRVSADPTISGLGSVQGSGNSGPSGHGNSVDLVTRSSATSSISGSPSFGPKRLGGSQQDGRSSDAVSKAFLIGGQENRASMATGFSSGSQLSGTRPDHASRASKDGLPLRMHRPTHTSQKKRHRTEVVTIRGAAGVGKSSFMTKVQTRIRGSGYFATARFDSAQKAPFEPLLKAMGSLFRQIFSESDLNTEYHQYVANGVRPFWVNVCSMLDLPESLLADTRSSNHILGTSTAGQNSMKSLKTETTDTSSTYSAQSTSSADLLRGSVTNRSVKFIYIFVEVLRILSNSKLICLCLDNIQNADDESLELLSSVVEKRLSIIIVVRMTIQSGWT